MKLKAATQAAHPDRTRYLRWIAGTAVVLLALLTGLSWPAFAARFGPMSGSSSECQICGRHRNIETVCGRRVRDEVTTNDYSNWLDTFVPTGHQHVWMTFSSTHRPHWFGGKEIGCGGGGALSTIHAQRAKIGDGKCRRLALRFHELVRNPTEGSDRYSQYRDFAKAVTDDPESLLGEEDGSDAL